jgi:hypothetical protein
MGAAEPLQRTAVFVVVPSLRAFGVIHCNDQVFFLTVLSVPSAAFFALPALECFFFLWQCWSCEVQNLCNFSFHGCRGSTPKKPSSLH